MTKLNLKEIKELIQFIKNGGKLKVNVFRAVKEFLLKHKDEIYKHHDLYFISDKWVYDANEPKKIQPLPGKQLFCGWTDTNDDTYHYWLNKKKTLIKYGITYNDFKSFDSINWFIDSQNRLYINNKYYKLKGEN